MTKQEFIEDLMDRLNNISSELEYFQNVKMSNFQEEEDEGLTQLNEELAELNDQINKTIYRSPLFFELQDQIEQKENAIDNYDAPEVDNYDLERIVDKLNEFGYEAFDTQCELYQKLDKL